MKRFHNDYLSFAAVALVGFATLIHLQFSSVPETIVNSTAPDSQFSGERAHQVLLQLLPENRPHPAGSKENKEVKNRIIKWLADHGIVADVNTGWGCYPDRGRCTWTENIVARIPGTTDAPYIALMAHYDSVDASPGAGDNMMSVAIISEIGRMLIQENHRNPVLLVFTDAEEDGRAGAEVLYTQHPIAKEIGLVLNMEGTGSVGESLLFRAINGNAAIVRSYSENAAHPRGTSLGEELIKILPSDTDLSVVDRVGITGADFGFAGFGKHTYHTPLDNTDNISLSTIQNHGGNLYGLVSSLVNQDLEKLHEDKDLAYETFYGSFLIWPLWTNYILGALSLLLLLMASYRREKPQLVRQFFIPLLLLVISIAIMVPTVYVLHFLRGETPLRPQFPIPYLMLTFGAPIFCILLLTRWLNEKWQLIDFLIGITWFWFAFGLLLSFIAPKAAHIFLLPAFTLSVLALIRQRYCQRNEILLLLIVVLVPVSIGKGIQLLAWQHYWFSFMSLPFSVFLASYLLPFLRGSYAKGIVTFGVVLFVAAAISTLALPTYDSENPQRGNLKLIQNIDTNESWLRFDSVNPVPENLSLVREFDLVSAIFPWGEKDISKLSAVDTNIETRARISSFTEPYEDGRVATVNISNNHQVVTTGLVVPADSGLTEFVLDGISYPISPAWWFDWQGNYVLELRGVQGKSVDLQLKFSTQDEVQAYMFEIYPGLPSGFEKEVTARNLKSVPIHDGDQQKVVRQITL